VKPVAYLHQGEAPALPPLLGALSRHGGHVVASEPGTALEAALFGLCPLGFAGAWIEGETLSARAAGLLAELEPEARHARRADAVACGYAGPRGLFLAPRALARLFEREVYPGVRVLWLGGPRPELAAGLRGVARVDVAARLPGEGEALLGALPEPIRGELALRPEEVRALAAQADLLLFAGGTLPLEVFLPYHTVLALAPVPKAVFQAVERVIEPERFRAERLALFVEEVLGLELPPQAFYEL